MSISLVSRKIALWWPKSNETEIQSWYFPTSKLQLHAQQLGVLFTTKQPLIYKFAHKCSINSNSSPFIFPFQRNKKKLSTNRSKKIRPNNISLTCTIEQSKPSRFLWQQNCVVKTQIQIHFSHLVVVLWVRYVVKSVLNRNRFFLKKKSEMILQPLLYTNSSISSVGPIFNITSSHH